jgi:hypothetical protein
MLKKSTKLTGFGLCALLFVAVFGGAEAVTTSCFPLSSGGKMCCSGTTCWKTSSEVCSTKATGLGNVAQICDPNNPDLCYFVKCSVFGTVDIGAGCNPNVLDPNCGIDGIAFCQNPQKKFNPQGNAYTNPAPIEDSSRVRDCTSNGTCKTEIEIEPDGSNLCNNNWNFVTFTAKEFNGQMCFCAGGVDDNNQCCADTGRTNGLCNTVSTECLIQRCNVNLLAWKPGDVKDYTCSDLP